MHNWPKDGALKLAGMPQYEEFSAEEVENIRQFIRSTADRDLAAGARPPSN